MSRWLRWRRGPELEKCCNERRDPFVALVLALALGWAGVAQGQTRPTRIVSIVPAATEMLFAIGAGPRVIGVSSFDKVPPEVESRVRVGALLDPDVERILSLAPDLVVVYGSQDTLKAQLTRAGIRMFDYRHGGLADIFSTLRALGMATGDADTAERLAGRLEARIAAVHARVEHRRAPSTLLVFGREPGAIRQVHASGGVGFLNDMLVAAGGRNVFADSRRESVQASTELLLTRRPEVILELRTREMNPATIDAERSAWQALTSIPAVKAGRILVLAGDHYVVPGPRVADAIESMARALHPDAFASR